MRIRFVLLLSCLLLVSLIGVGCGNYTELQYREPLDTIEVNMTSEPTLEPSKITVERPGTYAFKVENVTDDTAHALEIKSLEGAKVNYKVGSVRTENLGPGESNPEFKVHLEPGEYEFSCPIGHHKAQGEKSIFTVREG